MEHHWNLQYFHKQMIVGLLLLLVLYFSINSENALLLFHTINKFQNYAMTLAD